MKANFTFTFEANGKKFSAIAPDADRARCKAKAAAGSEWSPKAKLVGISWGSAI